ncbi:MAG TPA: DUF3887 domain-containing protein [Phycisphaerales bacterium]|nr:DUF3887 domain-containing protein [Phycisphaerales bacterium]
MESTFEQLSIVFGWLVRSTMQVSILVCLILAVKATVRGRLSARGHYCLWLLLFIRMVMPWAPASSVSVFNIVPDLRDIGKTIPSAAVVVKEATEQEIEIFRSVQNDEIVDSRLRGNDRMVVNQSRPVSFQADDILALIWLGGALIFMVYIFATSLCVWIEIRCRRPLTDQKVLDLLEDCKRQMGIHTPITVVENSRVGSPALFGFIRPRLLLPKGMLAAFGPGELRYVFLHELAHVKRCDIVVNWLMSCLQVLHWFNPLIWYAFYRMRADRELACDALALSRTQPSQSAEYGRTIVNLLERFSRQRYLPAMAGILESKSQLKRRITMIARFKKSSYRWSVPAVILLAVLGCVVLTNAQGTSQTKSREPKAMAKEFVELLVKGRFSTAARNFDSTVKNEMSPEKLKEVWSSITGQAGAFKRQIGIRTEKFLGSDIVFVTCEFKNGPLDVKVVYNNKRQISGLWFVPVSQKVLKGYQNSKSMVQIVTFRPKDGFSPRTAKDILDRFNNCVKFRVNTHHFRTEIREGKLYGSILTDSSAEGKALELMLNQCNELEFVNSKAADEQELAEHYAKGSPGLKTTESSRAVKFKNPQVVSTKPAAFANNVSASLKRIKVTFDQPMMDESWSWVGGDDTYPKTTGQPRYDRRGTTCSLPVNLQPGKVYWVGINSARYKNFQTTEGVSAVPYVILFATKGRNGEPTVIPDNFIEEAKRINARAGKMSSQPERKATAEVAEPYTQIMFNDISNDGTISFESTIRKISRDVNPVKTTSFVNSDFVNVTSMSDNKGRPIKFTTKHKGSHYRYNLTFNEPVLPGETMVYASEGTMTGLIKPVAGSKDTFEYFMTHWPAAGQPTRRIETYLLPEGAELISTTPEDMERRTKNGRIELHQEKMIPAGGSITSAFQYRLPVGKGGGYDGEG